MTLGGGVGFAVLSVLLLGAFSLVATAGVALAGARLRRAGPATERSAAAWALLAPIALTLAVVAALAIRGSGAVDHCVGHDHHAHLCFAHGGAWLARPWAVALAAASALTLVLRLFAVAWRRIQTRAAIAEVRRVAECADRVRIVRSPRVFCFVAGHRHPEVFVSSRAWEALSVDQREAVVAHERAHAAQGDLWFGALIDVAAVFAAPLAGGWLRARWADAGERLCDARAAQQTAPETVADALVRLCRVGHVRHVPAGFTPRSEALEHRVRAVLAGGPIGSALHPVAWYLASVAIIASAVFATHLHHALETVLG